MANTINENWIFNSHKEHWKMTLGQIDKKRWIPSERLKGLNSIFSTKNEISNSINKIINEPARV
jgi:hypothetical protein